MTATFKYLNGGKSEIDTRYGGGRNGWGVVKDEDQWLYVKDLITAQDGTVGTISLAGVLSSGNFLQGQALPPLEGRTRGPGIRGE